MSTSTATHIDNFMAALSKKFDAPKFKNELNIIQYLAKEFLNKGTTTPKRDLIEGFLFDIDFDFNTSEEWIWPEILEKAYSWARDQVDDETEKLVASLDIFQEYINVLGFAPSPEEIPPTSYNSISSKAKALKLLLQDGQKEGFEHLAAFLVMALKAYTESTKAL